MSPVLQPGVCRHCECTESNPCSLCLHKHDGCAWSDTSRLVCSGEPCIRAEAARLAAARAARPKPEFAGWGPGAIRLELERRDRNARQRRRRRTAGGKGRAA